MPWIKNNYGDNKKARGFLGQDHVPKEATWKKGEILTHTLDLRTPTLFVQTRGGFDK